MAVKAFIDVPEYQRDVRVSDVDLDSSFRDQASLFASYSFKHYEAMRQTGDKEILFDVVKGKVDKEIRERWGAEIVDGKPKKYTEAMIVAELTTSKEYLGALKDYNDARAVEGLLKNVLESFKQRKDMLVSLGANSRQEMEGELRMRNRLASDGGIPNRDEIMANARRSMVGE